MSPQAQAAVAPAVDTALAPFPSLIEVQLPVSKLSKECYKERKANAGQTLTALGSYWKGRKPLFWCSVVLGLLTPATDDPDRGREILLKLMLMDDAGLLKRKKRFAKNHAARVVQSRPKVHACALSSRRPPATLGSGVPIAGARGGSDRGVPEDGPRREALSPRTPSAPKSCLIAPLTTSGTR